MRLALDTGLNLGWAAGLPGEKPVSGTKVFPSPNGNFGRLLCAEREFIAGKIAELGVTSVIYETPLVLRIDNLAKLSILLPMARNVEMICRGAGIPCDEVSADDVRMTILGFAKAPKTIKNRAARTAWIKTRVTGYCIARGWEPKDDNEADAQLTLEFAHVTYSQKYAAANAGPLLTGARA